MWLRKQCLILSKVNATPLPFWLGLRLPELARWIRAHNEVIRDERAERDRNRNNTTVRRR